MAVMGFIIGGMLLLIFWAGLQAEETRTTGEGCAITLMLLLAALVCLGIPFAFWLGGKLL
jgi:hypothetical protein